MSSPPAVRRDCHKIASYRYRYGGEDSNRTTAIILLKTPYAIGFVVALFLHLLLPEDKEEEEEEESGKEMKVDPVEA